MSTRSKRRQMQRMADKKISFMEIGERANQLREADGVSYEEIMNHPEKVDHYNDEARAQLKRERDALSSLNLSKRVSNVEKSAAAHAFKSNGKSKTKAGPPIGYNNSTYRTGKSLYGKDVYGKPVPGTSKSERKKRKR